MPETRLIGYSLDPTDVVIDPEGQVIIPIWRPQNPEFTVFKLEHMVTPTLASAIRQCDHILKGYNIEIKGIGSTVTEVEFALGLYLGWDRVAFLKESDHHIQRLLRLAGWLEHAKRPEKRQAADHLIRVMASRGRDSRGRYNPQVMASYLFGVIFQLEGKRVPNLKQIVVVEASRKSVLGLTRQVNHGVLQTLCQELDRLIKLPMFSTRERPALLPYHELAIKVEQIALPTKRLWGAPYTQLAAEIRTQLGEAKDLLNQRYQLKAKQKIRLLIAEIRSCPEGLKKIRSAASALGKSHPWRQQQFAPVVTQCNRLSQLIEALPNVLEHVKGLIRHTPMQFEGLLTQGNWQKATEELNRFIARCEW
ncbi:hypothetical protein HYZ64_00025 [Candidatus Berkelbacteria bacterium]|nr:hypothetical protein [Candidatus Berkelbacteria bacterium]